MTREEAIRRIKARFDRWALDDEDMKAIQTLVPELKESEDERMINELQGFLDSFGSDYFGTGEWQKFDDWLEKQKEQKPAEFTHHETNESLKDAVTHQMEDDSDIDDFVRKGIDDVVLKYAKLGAKWQKEQNSSALQNAFERSVKDYSLEEKSKASDYADSILPISVIYGESDEEYKLHKIIEAAFITGQKEQKTVDFPTTDEEVKEFLETHPKVEVPEKYKTPDFVFSKQEYESHPIISKDTTSVKPAEWSDEDADMLNCCISSIEEAKENRYAYKETDGDTSYDREIDWLKSLRPWPHWKPSEGHLSALLAIFNDPNNIGSQTCQLALADLYEQLKKLM